MYFIIYKETDDLQIHTRKKVFLIEFPSHISITQFMRQTKKILSLRTNFIHFMDVLNCVILSILPILIMYYFFQPKPK